MSNAAPSGRDGAPPPVVIPVGEAAARELPPSLVIDCDSCLARGPACSDCVVSCLLGPPPPEGRRLDEQQVQAIDALSASGLVPPLRLVTAVDSHVDPGA
jgi:hypothetical protein